MTLKRTRPYLLITFCILLCSCNRTPEARRDRFLAKGKVFLQEKDYSRALLEFKNAARVMPADAEVWYQIGFASAAAGDYARALAGFRKALSLNPKHAQAQLRLAQFLVYADDQTALKEAQGHLQTILAKAPGDADALHALGLTEIKLGEDKEAALHLEQAMAAAPEQLRIAVALAQAKLLKNDAPGAEAVLKRACASSPKSADAVVILGKFYVSQRRLEEAERQFQLALAMDAVHAPALLNLASLQSQSGRKEEAERTFKRLSEVPDKTFQYAYGGFLLQQERNDDAIREFERLARKDSSDRLARTRLVAAYQTVRKLPDAQRVLSEALKKNPNDYDALLQRGELSLDARQYQSAEVDLFKVLKMKPDAAEAHYAVARLHQARGSMLQYRQELTEALRLKPEVLQVRVELAQALTAEGKDGAFAALDILNAAPGAQKDSTAVVVQRNWAFWTRKELAKMRKSIDLALSRDKSFDLLLQDGMLKLQEGKPALAQASLERALKVDPADLRALAALNQTYAVQRQSQAAIERIKQYVATQPKSAAGQQLLGLVLLANGDREQARTAFISARTVDPDYTQADMSLVQLDVMDSKWADAGAKLKEVLAKEPENSTARLWLGDVEAVQGNQAAALDHFRQVVEAKPDNPQALNNLAYLLAEYAKKPDEALKYAERAAEKAPEDPDYADTLGWILYEKGVYSTAVLHLKRAAAKSGNAVWKYHLAMAYSKTGDSAAAEKTLDAALAMNRNVPEAQNALKMIRGEGR